MNDSHILLVSVFIRTLVLITPHQVFKTNLNSKVQYAKSIQESSNERFYRFISDHQVSFSQGSLTQIQSYPSKLSLIQQLIELLVALWTRSLFRVTRLFSIKVVLNSKLFVSQVLPLDTSLLITRLSTQQSQLDSFWREDSHLLKAEGDSFEDDQ